MSKLLIALLALVSAANASERPLPEASLYQLDASLVNQSGQAHGLDVYRDQPVLIAMFYGACPAACPLLIESVRAIEGTVDSKTRSQLRVLFVSIDPARDSAETLAKLARQRRIDATRWSLARADARTVRRIAAMLNIQYRQLPDGNFNHTSAITLLDRDGVPVARTEKLGSADTDMVAAVQRLAVGR